MINAKRISFLLSLLLFSLLGLGILLGGDPAPVGASAPLQTTPIPIDVVPMSDAQCLECHDNRNMVLPFPSGEEISLRVDPILYGTSIHGRRGYACVQCHTDITGFPHPERDFEEPRDLTIYVSQVCGECHIQALDDYDMGAHAVLQENGRKEAAVCSDCHGAHTINEFGNLRTKIADACRQCHTEIYEVYKNSVHGEGLLTDFNPDVPSCIDCHDHHNNAGPTREGFHLFSPELCASCHTDETMMGRYDINTNVFNTFVADFHGTTVTIFERTAPDQVTNKPVCIDCHGVHDIRAPDNVDSRVFKQNLLSTCQRCHPDATPNFSDSWLNHYEPDAETHPIVYIVDLFYSLFIPATLGGMAIFVASDFWRTKIRKS